MTYLNLENLKVYQLSRELSQIAWEIFQELSWEGKKIVGFQFVESTDSVGANIAEGYGRFHYLDRKKFYYNARASLLESKHWLELICERRLIKKEKLTKDYLICFNNLKPALNAFINSQIKLP